MGASVRTARASASLGRESISISAPALLSVRVAKKVLSLSSVTVMRATSASNWPMMLVSRSWVIGRGSSVPCSLMRIAAASGCPIQMGRKRLPSTVLRRTIGCLPMTSKLTP